MRKPLSIPCIIDGCRRYIGKAAALKRWGYVPSEYICQAHWSRLPKRQRQVWARHQRLERKFGVAPKPEASRRVWSALCRRAGL